MKCVFPGWVARWLTGALALSLLLFSTSVLSQQRRIPPPPPAPRSLAKVIFKPSMAPLMSAFAQSDMQKIKARLLISFDAEGVAVDVLIDQASGDETFDRALIAWAQGVRITPGRAEVWALPFDMVAESDEAAMSIDDIVVDESSPVLPVVFEEEPQAEAISVPDRVLTIDDLVRRPDMGWLYVWFLQTGQHEVLVEADLDHDADGRVRSVRLARLTSSIDLDHAIDAWARGARLPAGRAGTTRLAFRLLNEQGRATPGVLRVYAPSVLPDQVIPPRDIVSRWMLIGWKFPPAALAKPMRFLIEHDAGGRSFRAKYVLDEINPDDVELIRMALEANNLQGIMRGKERVLVDVYPNGAVRVVDGETTSPP